jgi:hypothetical protein
MVAGHVRLPARTCLGLWQPNGQISLGAIKAPPPHTFLAREVTHLNLKTLWDTLLSSKPLSQAPFKSKFHRKDLSLSLEWPSRSSTQVLHWQSPCVCYSWDLSPRWTRCCPGVTKVVMDLRKFVLSSPSWGFVSENQNRSWWLFRED